MTFFYDESENELVGNNAFDDTYGFAEVDGSNLRIDVDVIMEEGRGMSKLREIRNAVDSAIQSN